MKFCFKKLAHNVGGGSTEGGPGNGVIDNTVIDVETFPTENVDNDKVYRMNEETDAVLWVVIPNNGISSGLDTLVNGSVRTYIVDSLPEIMDTIDNVNTVLPCYVIESTGVAYISQDGTSASAIPISLMFGCVDGGWIDSIEDIVTPEEPTIYTIRGAKMTSYGIPDMNSDKQIYVYKNQSWKNEIKDLIDENENLTSDKDAYATLYCNATVGDDGYGRLAVIDIKDPEAFTKFFVPNWVDSIQDNGLYYGVRDRALQTNLDEQGDEYLGNDENPYMVLYMAQADYKNPPPTFNFRAETKSLYMHSFSDRRTVDNLIIPETIVDIGESCFEFSDMTTIDLSAANIRCIRKKTFDLCYKLTTIVLPDSLIAIEDSAFNNCKELTLSSLPTGITYIGAYAFNGCRKLALSSLPDDITSIGDGTFDGCAELAITSIPSGVTSIGNRAFAVCPNIVLTSIPEGVTSIGWNAFQACTGITSIVLPGTLTSIGTNVFYQCTNLKDIYVPWAEDNAELNANAPWGATNATIHYNHVAEA